MRHLKRRFSSTALLVQSMTKSRETEAYPVWEREGAGRIEVVEGCEVRDEERERERLFNLTFCQTDEYLSTSPLASTCI